MGDEFDESNFDSFTKDLESSTVSDLGHRSVFGAKHDFKVTMAYEKTLTKSKCDLCTMYFSTETVRYKVANYRIFELQNSWRAKGHLHEEPKHGKRYSNASFLYTPAVVCTFCWQFFTTTLDKRPDTSQSVKDTILPQIELGPKLQVDTSVDRANIAENQRAYQSSEVDNKSANLAILSPYDLSSRTRREADPWWEVEFGRNYQIESISFNITVSIRSKFQVYIMLFDRPVGFENPFLDRVQSQAIYVKEFVLPVTEKKRVDKIEWKLSEKIACYAIRIQLKGIFVLEINEFKVLQGDEIIMATLNDFELSQNSFSSLDLQTIKTGLKEMLTPEKRLQMIENNAFQEKDKDRTSIQKLSEENVKNLSHKIETRYHIIQKWKEKVLQYSKLFTFEEIEYFYKIIFKPCYELYNHHNNITYKIYFNEYELLCDSNLVLYFPKCDLKELHNKLRVILRWIGTRSHIKTLGPLIRNEILNNLAVNPNEILYKFSSAIKRIEYYWEKREEEEKLYSYLEKGHNNNKHDNLLTMKISDIKGVSFSQFIILMNLFLTNQLELLSSEVFQIEHPKISLPQNISDDISTNYSFHSNDGKSISTTQSLLKIHKHKNYHFLQKIHQSNNNLNENSLHTNSLLTNSITFPSSNNNNKFNKSDDLLNFEDSLVFSVRKEENKIPFDSRFSEYKLNNLKRKIKNDINFPKTLNLEFAKKLIPSRAQTSSGNLLANSLLLDSMTSQVEETNPNDDNVSRGSMGSMSLLEFNGTPLPSRPTIRNTRASTAGFKPVNSNETASLTSGSNDPMTGRLSQSHITPRGSTSPLTKKPSMVNMNSGSDSKQNSPNKSNQQDTGNITPHAHTAPSPLKKSLTLKSVNNASMNNIMTPTPNFQANVSFSFPNDDNNNLDDFNFDDMSDSNKHKLKHKKEIKHIDFHRVCALCELRLPRNSVENKVVRKHVVKLRCSWDPKLVSKEVRSLDNTISMYNLVYVCVFCSQFFDPDFPDGIAYPVRVAAKKPDEFTVMDSISDTKGQMSLNPFYDTRYLPNAIEVGDVLKRPQTMESRERARRAIEVSQMKIVNI